MNLLVFLDLLVILVERRDGEFITWRDRHLERLLCTGLQGDRGAATNVDGEILVRRGMEFSDTFRAVACEMAGSELATDPELSPEQEFSAYAATYLLCKKYGADVQGFSFEDAPGVFDGMGAQEIKGQLSQIRDTAENISSRMARQLEAQQRAAKSQEAR